MYIVYDKELAQHEPGRVSISVSSKICQAGEFSLVGGDSTFCAILAFNWLNEAHPNYGEQSASLSVL